MQFSSLRRHPLSTGALLALTLLPALSSGCAPPPLPVDTGTEQVDGAQLPTIEFVFPRNGLASPVCPDFFVAMDIDGIEMVDFRTNTEPVDGEGHWHVTDDITGDYQALVDPYTSISADLNGEESRNYSLTATLNANDHTPFSTSEYPDSIALVEFTVADTEDCLGGAGAGGMDSGY